MISSGLLILASALTASSQVQRTDPVQSELTTNEQAALDSGRPVVREQRVASSAWPRVTIHQFIDATPEQAAAVFIDYGRHSSYIPGLKKSAVARHLAPRVSEVDYILDVPLYADEDYTVRDSLSVDATGATYRVDWVKVRARSTRDIVGSAEFRPYRNSLTGRDGTLLTYVNLVVPGQLLAGPFKKRALTQVRETVTALVRQVEAERSGGHGLLVTQVGALAAALRDPPVP